MVKNRLTDDAVAREKISQWMDGEADDEEACSAYAALESQDGRDTWALYHCIGEMLRDGAPSGATLSAGFTERVMQALDAEPSLQVPENGAPTPTCQAAAETKMCETKPHYCRWALAATVAGAVVVCGLALTLHKDADTPTMAVSGATKPVVTEPSATVATSGSQPAPEALIPLDYLITYQEFVPSVSLWPGMDVYQWVSDVKISHLACGR